ncbi:hypothetical protein EON64_09630 [archaeon]|nr:MAG: hypothetical protein EON64_09630 [archaeon]
MMRHAIYFFTNPSPTPPHISTAAYLRFSASSCSSFLSSCSRCTRLFSSCTFSSATRFSCCRFLRCSSSSVRWIFSCSAASVCSRSTIFESSRSCRRFSASRRFSSYRGNWKRWEGGGEGCHLSMCHVHSMQQS